MPINKKLIHFKTKENFLSSNGTNGVTTPTNGYYGNIPENSIVFIKDTKEIWTHGLLYGEVATSDEISNIINGEFVDLGLPSGTLWCTHNVGAKTPYEYGLYFQWGNINGLPGSHDFSTHSRSEYISNYGFINHDIHTDDDHDMAYDACGTMYRLPSKLEFEELFSNCSIYIDEVDEVSGLRVIGKNKNSIFLPMAGYGDPGSSNILDPNGCGQYWTSTYYRHEGDMPFAYYAAFIDNYPSVDLYNGTDYSSVRAVYSPIHNIVTTENAGILANKIIQNCKEEIKLNEITKTNKKFLNKSVYTVCVSVVEASEISNQFVSHKITDSSNYMMFLKGEVIPNKYDIIGARLVCDFDGGSSLTVQQCNSFVFLYNTQPHFGETNNAGDKYVIFEMVLTDFELHLVMWIDKYYDDHDPEILAHVLGYPSANYMFSHEYNYVTSQYCDAVPYIYKGETIVWNDELYYIWEYCSDVAPDDMHISAPFAVTDTIDYEYMKHCSKIENYENDWNPVIAFLNNDKQITYSKANDDLSCNTLVAIENLTLLFARCDNAPSWGLVAADILANIRWDGTNVDINCYEYIGDRINWNGIDYFVWELINTEFAHQLFILTCTIDYETLEDISIYSDINNRYCPYIAMLDSDMNSVYNWNDKRNDWIVAVREHDTKLRMYIDDFDAKW